MKMGVLNLNCWWISLNGCVSSTVPPLVCVMSVECNEAITKIDTALAGDIVLNLSKMCLHVLCCLCRLLCFFLSGLVPTDHYRTSVAMKVLKYINSKCVPSFEERVESKPIRLDHFLVMFQKLLHKEIMERLQVTTITIWDLTC